MKCRIKKGDSVIVLAGKDKGKKGEVLSVLPKEGRLVVSKVNVVKCHTRPSAQSAGGIVEKEASMHISNVALVDPKDGAATRVGYKFLADGSKVRVAKRSGSEIV